MNLKWKVCGMREQGNIQQVLELAPDFMGFIFFKKSPRYVGDHWQGPGSDFPVNTKKVGVFVNESLAQVKSIADRFQLDYIQLHGDETPEYCSVLSRQNRPIIKAVSINTQDDLLLIEEYNSSVKYILFDTPREKYGGTGKVFDWSYLEEYDNKVPIFLSGGISVDNIQKIKHLSTLNLAVIDVNSRFEIAPGLKDVSMLTQLKKQLSEL
jgi:phosphoribosylanthranilate isomerase